MMVSFFILLLFLLVFRIGYDTFVGRNALRSKEALEQLIELESKQKKLSQDLVINNFTIQLLNEEFDVNKLSKLLYLPPDSYDQAIEIIGEEFPDVANGFSSLSVTSDDKKLFIKTIKELIGKHSLENMYCYAGDFVKEDSRRVFNIALGKSWERVFAEEKTFEKLINFLCSRGRRSTSFSLNSIVSIKKEFNKLKKKANSDSLNSCSTFTRDLLAKWDKATGDLMDLRGFRRTDRDGRCRVDVSGIEKFLDSFDDGSLKEKIEGYFIEFIDKGNKKLKLEEKKRKELNKNLANVESEKNSIKIQSDDTSLGFLLDKSFWSYLVFTLVALIGVQASYQMSKAHNYEIIQINRWNTKVEKYKEIKAEGILPNQEEAYKYIFNNHETNPFHPSVKVEKLKTPQEQWLREFVGQLGENLKSLKEEINFIKKNLPKE